MKASGLGRTPRGILWSVVVALVGVHFLLHVGLGLSRVAPDLLTVALLLAAREHPLAVGSGMGLFFGLLEDSLSVLAFGANSVAMSILGTLGGVTRDLFVGESLLFLTSYFLVGKLLRDLLHWIMMGEELRQPFVDQVLI
ncbi:MAG: rod shape-determining protein MreD, partial [Gemmatimonadota bacterium]|nr:rod shape-determining protein MreD [Gemmatimonadota bacterium]